MSLDLLVSSLYQVAHFSNARVNECGISIPERIQAILDGDGQVTGYQWKNMVFTHRNLVRKGRNLHLISV